MQLTRDEAAVVNWAVEEEMEPHDVIIALQPLAPQRSRDAAIAHAKAMILSLLGKGLLEMDRRIRGNSVADVQFLPLDVAAARDALENPQLWESDRTNQVRDMYVINAAESVVKGLGPT